MKELWRYILLFNCPIPLRSKYSIIKLNNNLLRQTKLNNQNYKIFNKKSLELIKMYLKKFEHIDCKLTINNFLLTKFVICVWSLVIKLSVHSLKILVGCFAKNGRMHLSLSFSDRSNMFWLTLQFSSVQLCSVRGRNQFKSFEVTSGTELIGLNRN